jgi:hypothetical protein
LSRPRSAGARAALPSALIAAAALTGCGAQSSVSTTAATAQASKAATPAATPTPAAVHYVLSAPSTIGQWTLTTPTSTTQQKMQQGLSTAEQTLGISGGSPVMGLYNDPSKLVTAANTAPRYTTDGTGDNVSWTWVPNLAGGPHGGQVECNESVVSSGDLAAEGATCYWETATTGGVVTIYPQANRSQWDFGYSAKQMDGFMLTVRAAVEQLRN